MGEELIFIIVGCGGTGSLLARDLPKLLIGQMHKICLIDGDIIEEKNMKRQSYQNQDINENKAVALGSKISTFYNTKVDVISRFLVEKEILQYCNNNRCYIPVIIGCVDNDKTRKIIEKTVQKLERCIYIDSANSEYDGNVYVYMKLGKQTAGALRSESYKLDDDLHPLEESCQAQTGKGNVQYLVTNCKMATVLLEICFSILNGTIKGGVHSVNRFTQIFYK